MSEEPKFKRGDRVRKIKGSSWHGIVVGDYDTELNPEGYAVKSEYEKNNVQIYPAAALEKWIEQEGEDYIPDFAIRHANRENARLIQLLTDIRFALGDDGKRMRDELVEYCKEVKAERDRLRDSLAALMDAVDKLPTKPEYFEIPVAEARRVYYKWNRESYLNSNSGVEGQDET